MPVTERHLVHLLTLYFNLRLKKKNTKKTAELTKSFTLSTKRANCFVLHVTVMRRQEKHNWGVKLWEGLHSHSNLLISLLCSSLI